MAFSIPETFTEGNGQLSGYDTPYPFSDTFLNEILADQHIDLRIFSNLAIYQLRTQADLDKLVQSVLDTETQFQLEEVQVGPGEGWAVNGTPTGTTGSLTVGALPAYNNWSGAQMTCNGSALNLVLQSSMPAASGGAIGISTMDMVSFIVPDFHTFNTTTSTIQLCSNATGDFTSSTSNAVPFSSSTGSATNIQIPIGLFVGSGFSLSSVTGVKITLISSSAPSNGQKLTVMGLRALKSTWVYHTYDIDTRRGIFVYAPSLTGGDPVSANTFVPLVRGQTGGTADPRPQDSTLTMTFCTGNLTASNSGTPYNKIQLLFRENQGGGSGRYIVAEFDFKNGSTTAKSFKTANSTPVSGSTINYTGLPHLAANSFYIFQADLTNQAMIMNLWESNLAGVFVNKIWTSKTTSTGTNANYVKEQGRVGWNLSFVDRDAYLMNFGASTTSFSTMRTKIFNTYNPVDGAQLAATYSADTNLWRGFQGQSVSLDATKTVNSTSGQSAITSGQSAPSYASSYPIFSNDFQIDDFTQMYLDFDIFVPAQVTSSNQPYCSLVSSDTFAEIILPKPTLQPNQWNHVNIDLAQAQGNLTGIHYKLWIGAFINTGAGINIPYTWWVDNMFIGRRNVSWQFTANPGLGIWREFKGSVNDPYGGLKLPASERGTQIQLQAIALNEDAWIADFSLLPRYAPLGKPTYY